ncbi:hypothetical protein HYH02_013938 [Chlamydomonas schloesseri]|uniref:Uncharacterized protein n=1 Tax=Chlamydomonas schloesseri TaxID=2026947 RepID=A0A835VUN4_9CHLO|nr:hypothetical protein HYH02_013938 [Chlamydomonas schloesseri]|eukprot:KAG2429987.1 hypothetical protein HYH02_013938 [Chlamydomonas schloesseri]
MLQDSRGGAPLHIYMQGDSALRQQKNFLCHLLQPGFSGDLWALDVALRHAEPISGCYSPELGVRVTHVDNSCCNTDTLAHLARTDNDPYGSPEPPAWRPGGVGTSSSSSSGNGSSTQSHQSLPATHRDTTLVLYLNCGLHLMHLGVARPFECLPEQYGYMRLLRDFSDAAARLYPLSPQVFMTSNDICQSAFRGIYKQVLQNMTRDPEALIQQCVLVNNNVKHAGAQLAGNIPAITAACRNGLFIGESSRLLRERMLMAVAMLRRRHHGRAYITGSAAAAAAASAHHRPAGGGASAHGLGAAAADLVMTAARAPTGAPSAAAASGRRLMDSSAAAAATATTSVAAAGHASPYETVQNSQAVAEGGGAEAAAREWALAEGASASAASAAVPPTTVDVVDGYAITAGQCWASQVSDGRHYPYLVPMQVPFQLVCSPPAAAKVRNP